MNKRILTIQDISCVGQCSLTVALPIVSACGVETAILPSAVLSTHTAGFKGYTFRDLSGDMPGILSHWVSEGIKFDAVYTGYLGSISQIDLCIEIAEKTLKEGGLLIVDPAMGDNGKLYPGFNEEYAHAMGRLCAAADIILPNTTEVCYMIDEPFPEAYNEDTVSALLSKLRKLTKATVVLTGIGYREGKTGVEVLTGDNTRWYYEHELLPNSCHGTGDVYSSAFVGALMRGKSGREAAKIAADFTFSCIANTAGDKDHWYGVKFETVLPELIKAIE